VTIPLLRASGHHLASPSSAELDLFDAEKVREAVCDAHAVLHLASRVPTPDRTKLPGAWDENDRLRGQVTRLLVDGALSADTAAVVVPTIAFVYPLGRPMSPRRPQTCLSFPLRVGS
jgi:hypothetical protein